MLETKSCTISALGRAFGLSRSALLYYDRIGLLRPSGRTAAGYRIYTAKDQRRLSQICQFRQAGLTLDDIRLFLSSRGKPSAAILKKRMAETAQGILDLKTKQRLLANMLNRIVSGQCPPSIDKKMWIEMLRTAGLDDRAMECWHAEFERRAPEAHHEFLISLGIPQAEAARIRAWSGHKNTNPRTD
ncbi:MAG TPA: MerR family transcriptional regulator [Candidatus Paceibacterota bacterium]|nr:MerR family transcriptional regulator [Verrucomicrobiota bacterium]HRY46884.1 MerR family transcriptional regulator [Candidatus Paceibacterota bacterium]HSA03563.1 MerR family transcriptional regulator [Candidatus Paceibacterota bacterium]